jgi:small subunit ribosomal protein S1
MSLDDNRSPLAEAGTAEEVHSEPTGTAPTPAESDEARSEPTEAGSRSAESNDISHLLDSASSLTTIAQGEIVPATIIKMTDTEVVVDVGLKCEGAIPRSEFLGLDGQVSVVAGDVIHILIEHYNEHEGTVRVSYEKAARRQAWEDIEQAFQDQKTITGKVLERTKGGLTVDVGVPAFLPGSHADLRPHFNADALLGQEVPLKVIKVNRKRNNAVVSRRAVLEEELAQRKAALLEHLKEGAVLTGRVKNLTDYGAFVDLGGIDGLLHVTDLSWGRVAHPSEAVKPGQELQVKVLKYDPEKGRVSLGLKQLQPDPWHNVARAYHVGERVTGRVVGVVDYGAFVELEPGVEGLVHASEMSWSKRLKHPSKIVNAGDRVEVSILDVNPAQRRISLSLRHSLPDPWTTLAERHPVGSVLEGRVRNLTEFGAFVEIEEGIDGLVHLSNMNWSKDVRHPSEILRKGQKVEVTILGIDSEKRRVSLGLKQVGPDVWSEFCGHAQAGDVVRGKVTRLAAFGAFVEIEDGIEGLCHTSETVGYAPGQGRARLEVGKEYAFRILRLNPTDKKISLTMKDVEQVTAATEPAAAPAAAGAEAPAVAEESTARVEAASVETAGGSES